jgi:hypothetical protein
VKQVILKQELDPFPGSEITARIPIARQAKIAGISMNSDPRISPRISLNDSDRLVCRTVINGYQFEIGECLRQCAFDCLRNKPGAIISRDTYTYLREIYGSLLAGWRVDHPYVFPCVAQEIGVPIQALLYRSNSGIRNSAGLSSQSRHGSFAGRAGLSILKSGRPQALSRRLTTDH